MVRVAVPGQFTVHEVVYTATGIDKLAIDFCRPAAPTQTDIRLSGVQLAVGVAAIADATPTQFAFDQYLAPRGSSVVTSNAVSAHG